MPDPIPAAPAATPAPAGQDGAPSPASDPQAPPAPAEPQVPNEQPGAESAPPADDGGLSREDALAALSKADRKSVV